MYIPPHYRNADTQELLAFIRAFPFAVVACNGPGVPQVSHLPVLPEEQGTTLLLHTHFSKANPQAQQLHDGDELLVIFQGPHGYVSPAHYEKTQNVPTWNYVAVHARGKATVLRDHDAAYALLEKSIQHFEPAYFSQWKSLDTVYVQQMIRSITAVQITVDTLEGKFKLSQNKTAAERENIIRTFEKSDAEHEQQTAAYMKANDSKKIS